MPHFYWVSYSPKESFVRQMWGVMSDHQNHPPVPLRVTWQSARVHFTARGGSLSPLKDRHLRESLYRVAQVCGSETSTHAVTPHPFPVHCCSLQYFMYFMSSVLNYLLLYKCSNCSRLQWFHISETESRTEWLIVSWLCTFKNCLWLYLLL